MKRLTHILLGIVGALGILVFLVVWSAGERPGASAEGARLSRMQASPQWEGSGFTNPLVRVDGSWLEMTWEFFAGGAPHRMPEPGSYDFMQPSEHLNEPMSEGGRVTWLGHSSLFVELDGARVLIDPIWAERASPFTWAGPQRFHPPPIGLDALGHLDAVIISHDHYDHLDMEAVKRLADRDLVWLCPLGVGAHLESWGVAVARIVELDWWGVHAVGGLEITATPSRHFSGRSPLFTDQNATLWAGWALVGKTHRVFYSGDTALHPEFAAIGERLGPFDLTIMETGAYSGLWADVHLGPEQAVIAHTLLRGRLMMPVHWGTFDLALHGWTEPVERVLEAAKRLDVSVVIPRPGGAVNLDAPPPQVERWWPSVPWRSVEEAPAWSSSVAPLQTPLRAL